MKKIINPRKAVAMEVINFAQFAQKNDLELVQQKLSATSEELAQTKQNLYATSEDLMQTKEQIQNNFLGDETVKTFIHELAQKEVAEYKTIRSEFDGLGVRVTDLEGNLAVQEQINEDLALNGYLTPVAAAVPSVPALTVGMVIDLKAGVPQQFTTNAPYFLIKNGNTALEYVSWINGYTDNFSDVNGLLTVTTTATHTTLVSNKDVKVTVVRFR